MKKLVFKVILSLFLLSSLSFFSLQALAQAPGVIVEISSDTTWLMSDGPHVLTGPLLVKQGVALTIQAGSVVDLNGYELRVNGTLRAIGTLNNKISFSNGKITFTEFSNPWNQQTGTGSSIQFAVLESVEIVKNVPVSINDNPLVSDEVWTAEVSPVDLSGQLIVDEGKVLTINPGVTVNLNGFDLVVKGTLRVLGTDSNKVYFNDSKNIGQISFTEDAPIWNEQTNSGSTVKNSVLSGVGISSDVSINLSGCNITGKVTVAGSSLVLDDAIRELSLSGGSVKVFQNDIENITSCYGSPEISDNTIRFIFGMGGSPVISKNTIHQIGYLTIKQYERKTHYLKVQSLELANNIINGGVYVNCNSGVISTNSITGYNQSYTYIYDDGWHSALYYLYYPYPTATETILSDGVVVIGNAAVTGNKIFGSKTGILGGTTIQDNELINNRVGVHVTQSNAVIECNSIKNSDTGIIVDSSAEITNNTISNAVTGIRLNSPSTINFNNIEGCSNNSIYLAVNRVNIDAKNNWWGTTDSEAINLKIYDSTYSFDLGTVTFDPFLTEPNTQSKPNENPENPISSIPEFTSIVLSLVLITALLVANRRKLLRWN